MLQSHHLALYRIVNKSSWCTANLTLLLMQHAPCTLGGKPGTSGNRGSCTVHSAKWPVLQASRHAAVLSVTVTIQWRSYRDSKAFHNSPLCYLLDWRFFRSCGHCFLVWIGGYSGTMAGVPFATVLTVIMSDWQAWRCHSKCDQLHPHSLEKCFKPQNCLLMN